MLLDIFQKKLNDLGFQVNFVMDQDFKCAEFKVDDDPDEISQLRKTLMRDINPVFTLSSENLKR